MRQSIVIAALLGIFTALSRQMLRTALQEAKERNHYLEEFQATLEVKIAERMGDLRAALAEMRDRASFWASAAFH